MRKQLAAAGAVGVLSLVALRVLGVGIAAAQTSPDRCNAPDGVIVDATNQIAGGNFNAASATIGTIEMMDCRGNQKSCALIVQKRTDVINKQGDGWVQRAEAYKNLWTHLQCKPIKA